MYPSPFMLILILVGFLAFLVAVRDVARYVFDLRAGQRMEALKAAASQNAKSVLPVVSDAPDLSHEPGTCAACAHFDGPLGQKTIAESPAFSAAAMHVPPWRMGRAQKTEVVMVDKLDDAGQPIPVRDLSTDLPLRDGRGELIYEQVEEEIPVPVERQAPPSILALTWDTAGACRKRQELVFPCGLRGMEEGTPGYDQLVECDDYTPRVDTL